MRRSGWGRRAQVLSRAAVLALALASGPAAAVAAPSGAALDSVAARAFRLNGAGHSEAAFALAESALAVARARSDSTAIGRLHGLRGTLHALADHVKPAEADLRVALRLALKAGNERGARVSERWLSYTLLAQSRLQESDSLYRDLLARSLAAGDVEQEGWALIGLAYASLERGEFAASQPGYARAVAIFDSLGDSNGSLYAATGLARVRFEQGEFEAGAAVWRQVIARSRRDGNVRTETYGWNNLGVIMEVVGDPGEAARAFEQSRAIAVREGHAWDEAACTANVVRQMLALGRLSEADALLQQTMPRAEQGEFGDRYAYLLEQQAALRSLQGRPREAITIARQALALPHVERSVVVADLLEGIANNYVALGAPDSALAVVDVEMAKLVGRLPAYSAGSMELTRARCLLRLGRAREALAAVHRAAAADPASATGSGSPVLLALEARALRALGERERAIEVLARAADAWERQRVRPQDREWREFFGSTSRQVSGQLADLLLTDDAGAVVPSAARHAFDVLQRFKARTLEERVRGPHRSAADSAATTMASFATVERLQREVLAPGEVLLDAFVGEASCWLFLVTPDTCLVARLPAPGDLEARLDRFDRMLTAPARGATAAEAGRAIEETAASLGELLLGRFREIVMRSSRVIFAPDGRLNLLPIEALALAPAADPAAAPVALLAGREVVRVPSATLLARFRHRAGEAATEGALLALAGDTDAAGTRLAGARGEVRALASDYRGVLQRPAHARGLEWTLRELPLARAIHIAAHTHLDDERPWRSGALLAAADSTGADPWLRASGIAALRLRADLAVLSGCESAGGSTRSGEGVQGLATAFLEAGAPCVVATLWAVDDATTARLVGEFYRRLARGEAAAAALREAQLVLRTAPATRHPFYWAGFVLVGEGGARLKLVPRNHLAAAALPLAVLLAGVIALALWLRSRSRPGKIVRQPSPPAGGL